MATILFTPNADASASRGFPGGLSVEIPKQRISTSAPVSPRHGRGLSVQIPAGDSEIQPMSIVKPIAMESKYHPLIMLELGARRNPKPKKKQPYYLLKN